MIARCENDRTGEYALVSASLGASEVLLISGVAWSVPLSPSSERLAYAALGELAAEGMESDAPNDEELWRCEGMAGGAESAWGGLLNRGRSVGGDCDSRSSTEAKGTSGLLLGSWG
jgi:hypothetical protein